MNTNQTDPELSPKGFPKNLRPVISRTLTSVTTFIEALDERSDFLNSSGTIEILSHIKLKQNPHKTLKTLTDRLLYLLTEFVKIWYLNFKCLTQTIYIHNKVSMMKKNWYILCLFIAFVLNCSDSSFAQKIRIASSPNPVGSGARAIGMGGAFIGVADDATAASWNPGGLVQLKRPEISVVGNWFHRSEDNTFENNSEANGPQQISEDNINYFSMAYPFSILNRNMVVSLNYQHLYNFSREWDFPMRMMTDEFESEEELDYKQDGNLSALGIAYCIQITPKIAFGFTLNFWDNSEWEEKAHILTSQRVNPEPAPVPIPDMPSAISGVSEHSKNELYSFSGFNANIGLLWRATERLSIGMVFKSPFTADLKHEIMTNKKTTNFDGETENEYNSYTRNEELDMPMSYGLGVAYRFSDALTLSADIYRTEWQDFILTESIGTEISPITNKLSSESDIDPTYQIRAGAEYLFVHATSNYVVPIRAGLFYDPEPAEGSSDDFYGFSLGTGIAIGRYIFDMACQYRFGNDVGRSRIQGYDFSFSQDVEEYMIYSSLIIHF